MRSCLQPKERNCRFVLVRVNSRFEFQSGLECVSEAFGARLLAQCLSNGRVQREFVDRSCWGACLMKESQF